MMPGSKGQKAVHACMIRLLNLGPAKHEKVAIYVVNQRISNVCRKVAIFRRKEGYIMAKNKEDTDLDKMYKELMESRDSAKRDSEGSRLLSFFIGLLMLAGGLFMIFQNMILVDYIIVIQIIVKYMKKCLENPVILGHLIHYIT